MTLAEQVRSLITKRETIAAELVTIDADLAAVREALSLPGHILAEAVTTPLEISVDERRRRIIAALGRGPLFAALIARRQEFHGISTTTINNDLHRLKHDRKVRSTAQGWALVEAQNGPDDPVDTPALIRSSRLLPGSKIGPGPACTVCACPFKDHDPTNGRCYGKNAKCVCREFRS